jgi:hypothetical protein
VYRHLVRSPLTQPTHQAIRLPGALRGSRPRHQQVRLDPPE